MITSVGTILLVFGFGCALLAAFWSPQPQPGPLWQRVNFGWLAIAFLLAALIFGGIRF